jgi:DMSO/TMAO reductase YedYZ molybdopterin-dependent catalytic subunit
MGGIPVSQPVCESKIGPAETTRWRGLKGCAPGSACTRANNATRSDRAMGFTFALRDLRPFTPLLAYALNGELLPREDGGPLRLVG